jgi:hypothetical protein
MEPPSNDRLAQLAIAATTEEACPPEELLAAFLLGELRDTAQLSVAAHVRGCPFCQHDMALSRPPEPRPQLTLARLNPLAFSAGRRGGPGAHERQYVAGAITIDLRISPSRSDSWRLSGQVLRDGAGLPGRQITLRRGRPRYEQQSDELGFFSFAGLPDGRYTLTVDDQGLALVQVRGLELLPDGA